MKTLKNGRVRSKKLSIDEAAEKLADIAEKHLAKLSESERRARFEAFHKTVSRVCESHPKSGRHPQIGGIPALSRGRG